MRTSRAVRTWRGVAAAAFATFAASISHALADGAPPPALGTLLALTFAVPLCIALAGRRFSWVRLSVAVAASQFAFHTLLLVGDGSATAFAPAAGAHLHGIAATSPVGGGMPAPHDHAALAMWIAHAIAATVTVVAFGRGEQALRALFDLTGWRLVARLLTWRSAPPSRPLPAVGMVFAARTNALLSTVSTRGPPLSA